MEALNLSGADVPASFPYARPMGPDEFENVSEQAIILDTRMELGYSAAHVPGAVSIWLGGLSRFVGWFVPYDQQIKLVNENEGSDATVRQLLRLGYDDVAGILSGGMLAWHNSGRISQSISTITVQRLCYLLDERANAWILDVRSDSELAGQGEIGGAYHIHLTQLVERMDEVPRDRPVMVFCGSGLRSMIAASLLQRQGWDDVTVVLGGLAGWSSITCPLR